MAQYSLRLPSDLYKRAQGLAESQGVSLNQFFLYAISHTVSEVETRQFFEEKASRLDSAESERRFREILSKVPDRPADPGDELP